MEKDEECAEFVITTAEDPFVLTRITKPGEQYTLSFWIRSDIEGSITVCDTLFPTTIEWSKHDITFVAKGADLQIYFNTIGTYHIFEPQLEIGNMPTDYVPAPEDADDSIAATGKEIQSIRESVAQLSIDDDTIRASVGLVEQAVNNVSGELQTTRKSITDLEMSASQIKASVQTINDRGVDRVSTTTGVFDRFGLTIDATGSETKTAVTPDGMEVRRKKDSENSEVVLSATSAGVNATNLYATTYLIVGGRSRFENYGTDRTGDRTGCFWIGDVT